MGSVVLQHGWPVPGRWLGSLNTKSETISIWPILAVNFVGMLGFSIVLPFLVFVVTRWGGNALIFGLIGSTYSLFQLIGAPILGHWSDRYGRQKILLLSQLGTLISWCIFLGAFFLPQIPLVEVDSQLFGQFTITLPLLVLFMARVLDGITGGNISVAHAYLADISNEETRSENFGKMANSANLGFVVGPALAGLLGATAYGDILPVIAAMIISFVATLMVAFGLPESHPTASAGDAQSPLDAAAEPGRLSTREILRMPEIMPLLAIYFLVQLGFSFFYTAFPVYAATDLGWSIPDAGTYFAVMSLLIIVVQGPILTRASRRWTQYTLTFAGSMILIGGFLLLQGHSYAMMYAAATVIAIGNGLMWPSVLALVSLRAGETYQGAVQGYAGGAAAIAGVIGLAMGGLFFQWFNTGVFVISAATIGVVVMLAIHCIMQHRKRESASA